MANQKISALPPVASLAGTELIPVVQGGVNKTATPDDVDVFIGAVKTIVAGDNVTVDATDPANPVVSSALTQSSGTMNLVQLSDGAGGFSSDARLSYDSDASLLSVSGITLTGDGLHFGNNVDEFGSLSAGSSLVNILGPGGVGSVGIYADGSIELSGPGGNFDFDPDGTTRFGGNTKQAPVALATLGSAATAGAGTRAFINDGLTLGTWGATAVDGGSVVKPVWSNGTDWLNG